MSLLSYALRNSHYIYNSNVIIKCMGHRLLKRLYGNVIILMTYMQSTRCIQLPFIITFKSSEDVFVFAQKLIFLQIET